MFPRAILALTLVFIFIYQVHSSPLPVSSLKANLTRLQAEVLNQFPPKSSTETENAQLLHYLRKLAIPDWRKDIANCRDAVTDSTLQDSTTWSYCSELQAKGDYLLTIAKILPVYMNITAKLANSSDIATSLKCQEKFIQMCSTQFRENVTVIHNKRDEIIGNLTTFQQQFESYIRNYPNGSIEFNEMQINETMEAYKVMEEISRLKNPFAYSTCDHWCAAKCFYINAPRVLPHWIFRDADFVLDCMGLDKLRFYK